MGNLLSFNQENYANTKNPPTVTSVHIQEEPSPSVSVPEPDIPRELQKLINLHPQNEYWLCNILLKDAHGEVSGIAINNNTGNLYFTSNGKHFYKMNGYQQNKPVELLRGHSFGSVVWDGQHTMYFISRARESECILAWNTENEQISLSPEILDETQRTKRFVAGENKSAKHSFKFHNVKGITMDRKTGTIYASDSHRIHKIFSVPDQPTEILAGNVTGVNSSASFQDGEAIGEAKFNQPCGLAFRNGALFVADNRNYCIRKIKDGVVSSLNTPHPAWSYVAHDNSLTQAKFLHPKELCFDVNGDLLVLVHGQIHRIDFRKQIVSTVHLYPNSHQTLHSMCMDDKGNLFIGTSSKIYRVERVAEITWRIHKRYLWIGHLKEQPTNCLLATLPRDIIREIAEYL